MKFYEELEWRGLIHQVTSADLARTLERPATLYCGFDPTSDSLHIGSLLPALTLARFQKAGHTVIPVMGGATGLIGDPSFKATERNLLPLEVAEKNRKGIERNLSILLPGANVKVLNNYDWLGPLSLLEFLRDTGKHFTINHMTAKESVRARLEDREHGISFTEFSYMLLQAYDFYHLNKHHNCTLQIGGSDQWGNITAGIELIRRASALEGKHSIEAFGLTFPLLLKSDGTKFGKSESGNIWLSAEKTSVFQFHQYFLQVSDADVGPLLRKLTFLSQEEILGLEETVAKEPEKRVAQNALADAVTEVVHGKQELAKVKSAAQALFSPDIKNLDPQTLRASLAGANSVTLDKGDLINNQIFILDALVKANLASSKSQARKDIEGGGVYVNNVRINDCQGKLSADQLIHESVIVLRKGKRSVAILDFSQ